MKYLFLLLVSFSLLGCSADQEVDKDSSLIEKDINAEFVEEETLGIIFKYNSSQRNLNRTSPGSFGDIVAMRVSVDQVVPRSGTVINHKALQFNQNANSSSTTLEKLVVGREYNFIIEALDNMSMLIFKGNSIHRVRSNSDGNEISISLISQIQTEQAPIPRITRILKSDTVDYQQSTSILASVVIEEDVVSAPDLEWEFREYQDDPSKPCTNSDPTNRICGNFSPSTGKEDSFGVIISGSENPKKWYYDIFTDYTPSGDNNSITQHKLVFDAKNRQRIGVRQRFFISVTGPVPVSNSINTAPSLDEFSAQRIIWDNETGSTHYVLESSNENDKSLEYHCDSPNFECLEFSLTVSDDGDWNNVTASINLDNLSGTSSIGPDIIQTHDRYNGQAENKGVFSWIIKNFNDTTSGQIEVNVSDGSLQTDFILDVTRGDYVLTNVCDENGNKFGGGGCVLVWNQGNWNNQNWQ